MPTRCRSKCSDNKSVASCNAADKCSYTNGAVRKYCRLSSKYKMNKPNCNITRKFLKREKDLQKKFGNLSRGNTQPENEMHLQERRSYVVA
jgi:hypothetical protein